MGVWIAAAGRARGGVEAVVRSPEARTGAEAGPTLPVEGLPESVEAVGELRGRGRNRHASVPRRALARAEGHLGGAERGRAAPSGAATGIEAGPGAGKQTPERRAHHHPHERRPAVSAGLRTAARERRGGGGSGRSA